MVKYRCNFCGKGLPTKVGLKVHIRLSKGGCREAMERQINRSLSPADLDDAMRIPQRRQTSPTSTDENADLGNELYNNFPPFVPSPRHDESPELEATGNDYQYKRATGDEAEDEETYMRYAREFPTPAEELRDAKTIFEEIFEDQKGKNESPWAPFIDKDEWELARWLAKNVNQRATEEFLKMTGVSFIYFSNCCRKKTDSYMRYTNALNQALQATTPFNRK